jgi:hypothetical protein
MTPSAPYRVLNIKNILAKMTTAVIKVKMTTITRELAKSPILSFEDVNFTSGIKAKGNWKDRIADDKIIKKVLPLVPNNNATIRLGNIAIDRVIKFRFQRDNFKSTNP